jgi:hypothetical protein
MYSFFECNAIYEYFPAYLFNTHDYNLSIGIFPKESIYSMGGKNVRWNKYVYTNSSYWKLLSGRFVSRKESERNMAFSERYKI